MAKDKEKTEKNYLLLMDMTTLMAIDRSYYTHFFH